MICKREDHRTSDHEMYIASLKRSENYKAQPYQYASSSKQILRANAKPFPPCTHCGFNDPMPDDCRNYHECEICRSYDHSTSGHNRVIQIRGGRHIRDPIWYLDSGCSRSMTGVKIYLHKYVEQPGPKDKPYTSCEKGKHHRASFKTKQNFSIRKCLHLLHMDLFGPVSPMSINHKKYTLVIVDVYYRTDNGTEFRNHELESFYDEKGISQNFSSPYTPEQNGVAKRKNRTLIEAARIMLNDSVLSNHFWTKAVRIAYYTQNRSIIVKRHDKPSYEIFRERIPDISYFHVFGCLVFVYNHKDHLRKFDAMADDGYFLGYSFVSKAFRVFNTRRQQVEETYHVTFDESMEAIRFSNTLVDEIGIDDSSRYPPDEFLQEDDPSRQYQLDFDVLYYIIPHGRSLTELTQDNQVPKVIAPNEPDIPYTEDTKDPLDLINTERAHEQNVQNDQMITQPTDVPSWNNIEVSGSITESLVPDVTQWSRDQHIEHVNIIGDPGEGMLTRSMAAKLTTASASECLFADFLSEIEPKKVSEALKHPGWVDAIKSTSCACQILGGKLICWSAKKQKSVAMSLAENEYVAAAGCCASILWIKSQLSDYDIPYKMVTIFCDNTSAIVISNNLVLHSRTKHIDIRYHFIKDHILKGDIELHFIPTEYQLISSLNPWMNLLSPE
ncbi:retrovirus-related pol polyprotein from transposon TNT 1-94 [Tanacetum coccineum]